MLELEDELELDEELDELLADEELELDELLADEELELDELLLEPVAPSSGRASPLQAHNTVIDAANNPRREIPFIARASESIATRQTKSLGKCCANGILIGGKYFMFLSSVLRPTGRVIRLLIFCLRNINSHAR